MSCLMTKPTKWHMCPANTQISLGRKDSDRNGRMPRQIWVFTLAGRICHLLVLSWGSSFSKLKNVFFRMPLVYHILLTIAGVVDTTKGNSMKVIPSVASAYALLLHNRNSDMSAFQRLTSSICLEGHLTDEVGDKRARIDKRLSWPQIFWKFWFSYFLCITFTW